MDRTAYAFPELTLRIIPPTHNGGKLDRSINAGYTAAVKGFFPSFPATIADRLFKRVETDCAVVVQGHPEVNMYVKLQARPKFHPDGNAFVHFESHGLYRSQDRLYLEYNSDIFDPREPYSSYFLSGSQQTLVDGIYRMCSILADADRP